MSMYIDYIEHLLKGVKNYTIAEELHINNIHDIVYELDNLIYIGEMLGEEDENHFFDRSKIPTELELEFTEFTLDIAEINTLIDGSYTFSEQEIPDYTFEQTDVTGVEHISEDFYVMNVMEDMGGEVLGYNEKQVGTYSEEESHLRELDEQYSQSTETIKQGRKDVKLPFLLDDYISTLPLTEYDKHRQYLHLEEIAKGYAQELRQKDIWRKPTKIDVCLTSYIEKILEIRANQPQRTITNLENLVHLYKEYLELYKTQLLSSKMEEELSKSSNNLINNDQSSHPNEGQNNDMYISEDHLYNDGESDNFIYDTYYDEEGQIVDINMLKDLEDGVDYTLDEDIVYFHNLDEQGNEFDDSYFDDSEFDDFDVDSDETAQYSDMEEVTVYYTEDGQEVTPEELFHLEEDVDYELEGDIITFLSDDSVDTTDDYDYTEDYFVDDEFPDDDEYMSDTEELYDSNGNTVDLDELAFLEEGMDYDIIDGVVYYKEDNSDEESFADETEEQENCYFDEDGNEIWQSELKDMQEGVDYVIDGTLIEFLNRGSEEVDENAYMSYYDEDGVEYTLSDLKGKTEGVDYILDGDTIEFLTVDADNDTTSVFIDEITDDDFEAFGISDNDYTDSFEDSGYSDDIFADIEDGEFDPFGTMDDEDDTFEPSTANSKTELTTNKTYENLVENQNSLNSSLEQKGFSFGEMGDFSSSQNMGIGSGGGFGSPFGSSNNSNGLGGTQGSKKYQANSLFADMLLKFSDAILKTPTALVQVVKKPYNFLIVDDNDDDNEEYEVDN